MLRSINTDGKIWTELDNSFETMNAKYVSMKTDCFIPLDLDKDIKLQTENIADKLLKLKAFY